MEHGGISWTYNLKNLTNIDIAYNYGISGSTIQHMENNQGFIDRYNYMDKNADYIIIWGGVNDFMCTDTPIEEFKKSYDDLIKLTMLKYPNAKILAITPMKFEYKESLNNMYAKKWDEKNIKNGCTLEDYRNAEIEVLNKYNITVLDLYNDETVTIENEDWTLNYFNSDIDKLHPNTKGNLFVLAPKIAKMLNNL